MGRVRRAEPLGARRGARHSGALAHADSAGNVVADDRDAPGTMLWAVLSLAPKEGTIANIGPVCYQRRSANSALACEGATTPMSPRRTAEYASSHDCRVKAACDQQTAEGTGRRSRGAQRLGRD